MLDTSPNSPPEAELSSVKRQKRNAADTKDRLLQAAIQEFCERGYDGARVERIVKNANCNIRMAYHHFGDKEGLYLAVLEKIYGELRQKERELNLEHLDPVAGMQRLVEFTFDHMAAHPEFISLVRNENLLGGRMLKKSSKVTKEATPLVGMIRDLLLRGEKGSVFRKGVDPMQLYISILSLSYVHISNRHTLSILFEKDLASPEWLKERRAHSIEVIMSYLQTH